MAACLTVAACLAVAVCLTVAACLTVSQQMQRRDEVEHVVLHLVTQDLHIGTRTMLQIGTCTVSMS